MNENKNLWVILAAVIITGTGSNIDLSHSIEETNRHVDKMIEYFEGAESVRSEVNKALSILAGSLQQYIALDNIKGTECAKCHSRDINPLPKGNIDFDHFRKFLTCEDRWYINDMPCYTDKSDDEIRTLYGYIYLNQQ